MADSFTPLLGFRLQQTGNNSGTWGDLLNTDVITKVENAIANVTSVSTTGGTTTLTEPQRVNGIIDVRGTLASDATIVLPSSLQMRWYIYNGCTLAGHTVNIKTSAGSAIAVAAGLSILYSDGTNALVIF